MRRAGGGLIASLSVAALTVAALLVAPAAASSGATLPASWVSGSTPGSWLSNVSCTQAFGCLATGGAGSGPQGFDGPSDPLQAHFDGASWTIEPPAAADVGGSFDAVGCAPLASDTCLALEVDGPVPVALTLPLGSDGSGHQVASPLLVDQDDSFASLTCPAADRCLAAGASYDGAEIPTPLVEGWNGRSWHVVTLPRVAPGSYLNAVSCPTTRLCVAVGGTPGPLGISSDRPLAFDWMEPSSRWRAAPLTDPSRFAAQLTDVSCAAGSCTALGSGGASAFTETLDEGRWSAPSRYTVPHTILQPTSISCVAGGTCVVVGNTVATFGPRTFAAVERNGDWSALATSGFPTTGLADVSCSRTLHACVVVGGNILYSNVVDTTPAEAGVINF